MTWCSACGEELSEELDEAFHDPEGDWIEANLGIESGPIGDQESHIKVIYRETGPVIQCQEDKQMTKLQAEPPDGEGEPPPSEEQPESSGGGNGNGGNGGGGSEPEQQKQPQKPQQKERPQRQQVYDDQPDKDAMGILGDVITNPAYELSQEQIEEVGSWGDIYDGQIPPDQLEELLKNLSGVSSQRAQLMRQKYEAKLNKWVRSQSGGNSGPSLGMGAMPPPQAQQNQGRGPPQPSPQPQPQPTPDPEPEPEPEPETKDPPSRKRRERREEMVDKAADEFAQKFALNAAEGAGTFVRDIREVARTVMKKKAETDPEWFFEKAESWDMDLFDDVMSMSDAKAEQEQGSAPTPEADAEVDSALDGVMGGGEPEPEPPSSPPEPSQKATGPMKGAPEEPRGEQEQEPVEETASGPGQVREQEPEDGSIENEIDEMLTDMEE